MKLGHWEAFLGPSLGAALHVGPHKGRAERGSRLLSLLDTLPLVQPSPQLVFWAASAPCWLVSSFSSTRTHRSLSQSCSQRVLLPLCLSSCLGLP